MSTPPNLHNCQSSSNEEIELIEDLDLKGFRHHHCFKKYGIKEHITIQILSSQAVECTFTTNSYITLDSCFSQNMCMCISLSKVYIQKQYSQIKIQVVFTICLLKIKHLLYQNVKVNLKSEKDFIKVVMWLFGWWGKFRLKWLKSIRSTNTHIL